MSERRRVSLYGHRLGLRSTGISRYVDELTTRLARTRDDDLAYELGGSPERTGAGPAADSLVVRRPSWPRPVLHGAWTLIGRPRVDRWLDYPDLIHVLEPSTPVPARGAVVYTIHDLMPILNPSWHPPVERLMFRRSVERAAAEALFLIANSHKTAREVVEHLGVESERVPVVHLGVSDAFGEPATPEFENDVLERFGLERGGYVIMLGAVSTRKNPATVVRAVARSRAGVERRLKLVLAGPPGAGADAVDAEIDSLGISDRVVRTGWLVSPEIVVLVQGAAALLHPSVDEGFGLPPLEAMTAGVPTVASSAGSLPEVCGDAALLVDPGDVDAWAAAIDRVLDDEELRAQLIARGHRRREQFTWERCALETMAWHRRALEQAPIR